MNLQLAGIGTTLEGLRAEIDKFNKISKHISEKDFELKTYIRHMDKQDKHKLELMQEVDRLQRLVGKMRRRT